MTEQCSEHMPGAMPRRIATYVRTYAPTESLLPTADILTFRNARARMRVISIGGQL